MWLCWIESFKKKVFITKLNKVCIVYNLMMWSRYGWLDTRYPVANSVRLIALKTVLDQTLLTIPLLLAFFPYMSWCQVNLSQYYESLSFSFRASLTSRRSCGTSSGWHIFSAAAGFSPLKRSTSRMCPLGLSISFSFHWHNFMFFSQIQNRL